MYSEGRERIYGANLFHVKRFRFECGDVDLLVSLLCLSEGASRELASLVGHEMAPVREHQVLQVQHLPRPQLQGTQV